MLAHAAQIVPLHVAEHLVASWAQVHVEVSLSHPGLERADSLPLDRLFVDRQPIASTGEPTRGAHENELVVLGARVVDREVDPPGRKPCGRRYFEVALLDLRTCDDRLVCTRPGSAPI